MSLNMVRCKSLFPPSKVTDVVPAVEMLTFEAAHQDYTVQVVRRIVKKTAGHLLEAHSDLGRCKITHAWPKHFLEVERGRTRRWTFKSCSTRVL